MLVDERPGSATTGRSTLAGGRAGQLPYWRSLDGLRGLAVFWVMGFHAGLDAFEGGYLGVSAFFTLSGFLLTSLALAERERSGGFSFRRFWARRFRRLMPAALVTLGAIVVMGSWVWSADQLARLRGDVLSALVYVENWRLIFTEHGYAQAFQAPSPVQHFWSLAIEEQFYMVFPLALGAAFLAGARARTALVGIFVTVAAVSTLAMAVLYDATSTSRAYLGTGTRLAEIAIGCLLAVVVNTRPEIADRRRRTVAGWLGLVALAACLALWITTAIDSAWLYHGGFALHGLAIAVVLVAAVQATGPVPRLLGVRPLVLLGVISYGVYLYHWPIFLWLDHERTGLSPIPLFVLRVAVTLAVAIASYRLLERPARRGRLLAGWRPAIATPIAIVLIVAGVFAVTGSDRLQGATALPEVDLDAPPPTTVAPEVEDRPTTVMFFGDSVALSVSHGLDRNQEPLEITLWNRAYLGCGIIRADRIRSRGEVSPQDPNCRGWPAGWQSTVEDFEPDLALFLGGAWDVVDREVDGRWIEFASPESDALILAEIHLMVDVLGSSGGHVVVLTSPYFTEIGEEGTAFTEYAPWRIDHWNALLRQVAAERPDEVTVIELGAKLAPDGVYTDTVEGIDVRGDGIHLSIAGTDWIAEWLAPQLHALRGEHPVPRDR